MKQNLDSLVEGYRKTGRVVLEDENGGQDGVLSPETAKTVVEMLEDASNIVEAAYGKLESEIGPVAMEDDSVKQVVESVGKMMDDIDSAQAGVANLGGMSDMPEAEDDDEDEDDMQEDDDASGTLNPNELDAPAELDFSVKGLSDEAAFTNELADLISKFGGVMTVNEEDTIITPEVEPRVGEQPDDKEVSKEIAAHMDLEGKLIKFRVTEGVKAAIKGRIKMTKTERRKMEAKNRKFTGVSRKRK